MFQVGQHVQPPLQQYTSQQEASDINPPFQQYMTVQEASDINPPFQQYGTMQHAPNITPADQYLPLPTPPTYLAQGYQAYPQQQQIEQVCFIQLCFVIVYIVC